MSQFVFSADGHIMEPGDVFSSALPVSLRPKAIVAQREDDYMVTRSGDQIIHRFRIIQTYDYGGRSLLGIRELAGRKLDMEKDGINAELVFPSLGLWTFTLEDPELELATTEIYNNWCSKFFADDRDTFVPAGILPVRDFANTLGEIKRAAALGFTTLMLPSVTPEGIPAYNSEKWDPIFHLAGELGVVFALHTGTGLESVVQERGPGGAVINYTLQMNDSIKSTMYLVAGGVLDRNPKAKVAFIESGASWLGAVAERMDESYIAHDVYVRPKLSRLPSQIVRDQIKSAFQHDRECIIGRQVTGHEAIMWGADYPHQEGTFPHSREVIKGLFEGIDISEDEKADIIGRTAARFFGLERPEFQVKAA
jgi:predicted TIM-barrel fold metal-dependent hydrolase